MRLIDADPLYEEHTRLAYEGDYAFHITARAWVEKQPTVDAVPVVRCHKCIFLSRCQLAPYLGIGGYCSSGKSKNEKENT